MVLPTWIPDALRSEQRPLEALSWRCVEAQHVVSTLKLVDTLDEQSLLEDILEETKPPVPPGCAGLHYLYMTPFRYGPYPNGSRFRRAGPTPGVLYASDSPRTALIETAFHRLLFYAESPDTPFPDRPAEHTAFDVPVASGASIDLRVLPFSQARGLWMHPVDYGDCQSLEALARAAGIGVICYSSARDPDPSANLAILTCTAIAASAPQRPQAWRLWLNRTGVHAVCEFEGARFSIGPEAWQSDPRLAGFHWARD
jgi:hypothetical protein